MKKKQKKSFKIVYAPTPHVGGMDLWRLRARRLRKKLQEQEALVQLLVESRRLVVPHGSRAAPTVKRMEARALARLKVLLEEFARVHMHVYGKNFNIDIDA